MDIGHRLRECREAHGVTLREVAASTKLSPSTLGYIERNEIERLPGGILTRGSLRSYAAAIGGDADHMVEEYLSGMPLLADAPAPVPATPVDDDPPHRAWTMLAVAALVIAAYVMWSPAAPHREPQLSDASALIDHSLELRPAAVAVPALNSLVTPLSLEVSAAGPCWIAVSKDGQPEASQLLQDGDRVSFDAQDSLLIRIGDPQMFTFTVNGRRGRSLGEAGQPITVRITPENHESFLAVERARSS